jgi:hypothetical protein
MPNANGKTFSLYLLPKRAANYFSNDDAGYSKYAALCSVAGLRPITSGSSTYSSNGQVRKACAAGLRVEELHATHGRRGRNIFCLRSGAGPALDQVGQLYHDASALELRSFVLLESSEGARADAWQLQ